MYCPNREIPNAVEQRQAFRGNSAYAEWSGMEKVIETMLKKKGFAILGWIDSR